MLTKALLVRLEALPGKETELADFLTQARSIVLDEPGTIAWFAIRFGPSTLACTTCSPTTEPETPISPVATGWPEQTRQPKHPFTGCR